MFGGQAQRDRESRLYSPLRSLVHFCSARTWQQWHWPCALKDRSQWPQTEAETEAGVYLMYWACRAMYFENREGSQHTETLIYCCCTVLGCSKGINTTEQYKISQVSLWWCTKCTEKERPKELDEWSVHSQFSADFRVHLGYLMLPKWQIFFFFFFNLKRGSLCYFLCYMLLYPYV